MRLVEEHSYTLALADTPCAWLALGPFLSTARFK